MINIITCHNEHCIVINLRLIYFFYYCLYKGYGCRCNVYYNNSAIAFTEIVLHKWHPFRRSEKELTYHEVKIIICVTVNRNSHFILYCIPYELKLTYYNLHQASAAATCSWKERRIIQVIQHVSYQDIYKHVNTYYFERV